MGIEVALREKNIEVGLVFTRRLQSAYKVGAFRPLRTHLARSVFITLRWRLIIPKDDQNQFQAG